MPIRLSGLNSGLDTDSIVQELVSAYRTKQDKYTKAQTKLSWKQESWKDMNTKIYNFYSKTLSNMRRVGNFNKKTTTVSDETKAKVTAGAGVVNGTQTLEVKRLATAGYLTGGKIKQAYGGQITNDTSLSALGVKSGNLTFDVGGERKTIFVNATDTVADLTKALGEKGISANFDVTQQRFILSSKTTGVGNDFSFVVNEGDTAAFNMLNSLGLATEENFEAAGGDYAFSSNGMISGSSKFNGLDLDSTSPSNDLNNLLALSYKIPTGTMKFNVGGVEKTITVDENSTWNSLINDFDAAGMKLEYDSAKGGFNLSSKNGTDAVELVAGKGPDGKPDDSFKVADSLGLATKKDYQDAGAVETSSLNLATKQDATNAQIILNGALFEGESNDFSINGLNITATGVSNGAMTITTSTDVDGVYDMIKSFFKEYNELMNSMESAYNAPAAKGYEPLTDDEKEAMSEKEIEKWETKIKDSILRRDETLRSVMSNMSMNMAKVFEVDGKKYSLASFGIKTAGYFNAAENESYAYHIDHDEDDAVSSGNDDKLRKMIAEDPDGVASFFTQLANTVYDGLHEKMQATSSSSIYKVYNDKQMQDEYDEYTKTIKKWEEKLQAMEDAYYKKFAAMETALGKLQSQTNSLSSLFGG